MVNPLQQWECNPTHVPTNLTQKNPLPPPPSLPTRINQTNLKQFSARTGKNWTYLTNSVSVQLHSDVQAALQRLHKVLYGVPLSLRTLFGTFSLVFCLYFVPGDTLWCVDNVSGISLCQCRGQPWPSWNGWHWRKLCLLSIAASAIVHSLPKKCTLKSSWRKTRYLSCTMVCRCI